MSKIHYTTTWSTAQDYGGAINRFCDMVPDNDWICVLDGDTCFLTSNWGKHIEDSIHAHGHQFPLMSCMTNRVGVEDQLVGGFFSNGFDMKSHEEIARHLNRKRYAKVKPVDTIAGLLMLFPKSLWAEVGGFKRNTKYFDRYFSKSVKSKGHQIGVMEGLYVYHHYRVHYPTKYMAERNSKHLGIK